jgi:hypothetical protein
VRRRPRLKAREGNLWGMVLRCVGVAVFVSWERGGEKGKVRARSGLSRGQDKLAQRRGVCHFRSTYQDREPVRLGENGELADEGNENRKTCMGFRLTSRGDMHGELALTLAGGPIYEGRENGSDGVDHNEA